MKIKKKVFDIFNLSFLDIISCGFGAVVLLVLISNNAKDTSQSGVADVESLLDQVQRLENGVKTLENDIVEQKKRNQKRRTWKTERQSETKRTMTLQTD